MSTHNEVFNLQIWDFFQNDMDSCFVSAKRAQESDGMGGQNFTAATIIFTVLDFCAGFYHGKVEVTSIEVSDFITKYLGARNKRFENKDFTKQFYNVFRHGLVHQWSPKFSGVGMNFANKEILYEISGGILILNVPPFYDLVIQSLKDFENNLDEDAELRSKFEKRLSAITDRDAAEAVKLNELMK